MSQIDARPAYWATVERQYKAEWERWRRVHRSSGPYKFNTIKRDKMTTEYKHIKTKKDDRLISFYDEGSYYVGDARFVLKIHNEWIKMDMEMARELLNVIDSTLRAVENQRQEPVEI